MSSTKLKKAPLKEVIFELHWQGSPDAMGVLRDEGFDLAQGKFADRLKKEFPVHKKLIPDGVPLHVFDAPIHQYWKGEFKWPVVQHGQGMLAVNEVEAGYEWEKTFKPTVLKAINLLLDSYEVQPQFNRAKLQYIDAWDVADTDPRTFTKENLLTQIKIGYPMPGTLGNFNIFQSFVLDDGSEMQLNIANGVNNQNQMPSVVSTTTVEKRAIFTQATLVDWLEMAHSKTSHMFKTMLDPDFYGNLDR